MSYAKEITLGGKIIKILPDTSAKIRTANTDEIIRFKTNFFTSVFNQFQTDFWDSFCSAINSANRHWDFRTCLHKLKIDVTEFVNWKLYIYFPGKKS